MGESKIKWGCRCCGCSEEKIKVQYSGPIIRIYCPECGYNLNHGYDGMRNLRSIEDMWNYEMLLNHEQEYSSTKEEKEESVVRSAWDILRYCKDTKNCADCIFVKATEYRKTFKKCPLCTDKESPNDWRPPFLDIFDKAQIPTPFSIDIGNKE